jgi:hypothetical protein
MLTFVDYVGHSSLPIYISYTSMLAILFTSFFFFKLLILNMNGVLCYFLWSVIIQGKQHVRGRNIDGIKVETRARIQHFFICAFKKFYIGIWSCMFIEDVMEVLILLLLQDFIDRFVFI